MNKILLLLCVVIGIQSAKTQTTYNLDSTVLTARDVIDSIDIPWEIIWGTDNHIWMTERFGRVSRIDPNTGQQSVLLDISPQVYQQAESGLLGMALHPDFSNQPYVYLVYTYLSGGVTILERLVRYSYNGVALVSPLTLLDNIPGNGTHNGSRLIFLPDTTLLMTTGDAQNQASPQNVNSMNGKVLRLTASGAVPADNPDPSSYVWTWGHRNAQGLWLAPNGHIYCSEHGPTTDDELHIIEKGRNYGWPTVAGYCDSPPELTFCSDSNVVEPLAAWTPTIAPGDIIWYDHPAIPEFENRLLMTVLKDKKLVVFGFNAAGDVVTQESHYLTNQFGRLRDICVSPDGKIYLATNGASWSNTNPFTHKIIELHNAAYQVPSALAASPNPVSVEIWPNPIQAGQSLQVQLQEGQEGILRLYDVLGHELFSKQVLNNANIELLLPAGVYVWRVEMLDSKIATGKLIVR